jgi:O-antigen/teichoic acid export membrane protein
LLAALVLMCIAGWRPRLVCRWQAILSLLRTGLPLTASTLLQIGRYRIFAILIGGTAGSTALGQIHVAFRLADTVREIAFTALWRLMLPILSEHQHDRGALLRHVDRLLRLASTAMMPLCGGLAVALVPVTTLVLGPAWREAGAAAEPLVALTALLALMFPSGVALVAVGRARLLVYANLAGLVATMGFVLVFRPTTPWQAVLVWCGVQAFISPYSLWMNARALDVAPLRPLLAGVPMLLVSAAGVAAAMAVDASGPLELLIRRLIVFLLVVVAGAAPLLWHRRAEYFGAAPPSPRKSDGNGFAGQVPHASRPRPRIHQVPGVVSTVVAAEATRFPADRPPGLPRRLAAYTGMSARPDRKPR